MGKVDQLKAAKFDKLFQPPPSRKIEDEVKQKFVAEPDVDLTQGSDDLTQEDVSTMPVQAGFKINNLVLIAAGLAVVYFAFGKKLGIRK